MNVLNPLCHEMFDEQKWQSKRGKLVTKVKKFFFP